jgi:hypothetical protein
VVRRQASLPVVAALALLAPAHGPAVRRRQKRPRRSTASMSQLRLCGLLRPRLVLSVTESWGAGLRSYSSPASAPAWTTGHLPSWTGWPPITG